MGTKGHHAGSNRRARAFTMVEVLCASVILTVGLLSSFYLFAQGTAMNTDSKAVMAAHLAAQKQVEALRNTPFASVASGTFTPANTNLANPTGTVTVVNHGGAADLKDVTVVVGWKDRGGADRSAVVVTTIGQEGIGLQ